MTDKADSAEKLPDSEIAARVDRALRRMIAMPPKPFTKKIKAKKPGKKAKRRRS